MPGFRSLLLASFFSTLAGQALAVVIGFQVYRLTGKPLALGLLGLIEAIPSVGLALYGGHISDRNDRKNILVIASSVSVICAGMLAFFSHRIETYGIASLYAVVFVAGIARGFADPARTAIEAQIVPREHMVNASAWAASVWQGCAIIGPALGGLAYGYLGAVQTYIAICSGFFVSWIAMLCVPRQAMPSGGEEDILKSIAEGVSYVFKQKALVGSMALDLFAVLFGGVTALLPVFAADILKCGPEGLGILAAAPAVGSLLAMGASMLRPPKARAGRTLIFCVAGFGVSIIVFGFSKWFILSWLSLMFSGICDGISVVIRRSIIRLMSPDHLRGRIAAVAWVFIGSSNELGAFESGVAASLFGVVPSVIAGGVVTLLVVAIVMRVAPELRTLRLE